jgi:SAM-dependent methyltransferase
MNNTSLQQFILFFKKSLQANSFIKLKLASYKGTELELKTIDARKILVKKEEKLSFTYHYKTRDIIKNYSMAESESHLQKYVSEGFYAATLFTIGFDLYLEQSPNDKSTLKKTEPTQTMTNSLNHDKQKNRLIKSENKPYLYDLHITDEAGNIFKNAQDKYRQINKYVEILSVLIKHIPPEQLTKIVDMGSGKGYLTFALYDYVTNTLGLKVDITGVDLRADMVDLCTKIAQKSSFQNLYFTRGSIEQYDSTGANILIALHACDIATDQAIAKGIHAGAELIVVAPCCHKQIRQQMQHSKAHNHLDFLTEHGIFMERQAEMVTDGLRALMMQYFGYSTKIFEFISDAHTPKNIMIVGTKNKSSKLRNPALLDKINETKAYFGIEQHYLEKMMGI